MTDWKFIFDNTAKVYAIWKVRKLVKVENVSDTHLEYCFFSKLVSSGIKKYLMAEFRLLYSSSGFLWRKRHLAKNSLIFVHLTLVFKLMLIVTHNK